MVCGSRSITDKKWICNTIEKYVNDKKIEDFTLIEGGAKGVDQIAREWATVRNIHVMEVKAEWNKFGGCAGIVRNRKMVEMADYVLILWDGISRGTKSDIDFAIKLGKKYKIEYYKTSQPNT